MPFGIRHTLMGMAENALGTDLDGDGAVGGGLTREELIHKAFTQALHEGVRKAVDTGSARGGYMDDAEIHLPFPSECHHVRSALCKVGKDELVDEVVEKINRAAEEAAGGAFEVFIDAVCSLTLSRAADIISGDDDEGCTRYLVDECTDSLTDVFAPVVDRSLDSCEVVSLWDRVVELYNKIPLVPDIEFDLRNYCVAKAVHGIFRLMARQERAIRADPGSAASGVVQKVFSSDFWR
eukprot:TRINITY_DN16597_c0_g1_i1.p1 TRINITY_DN16597_c0_g1~~TRINITY_DN16597_c0_g1_i1.p1  ORF type:complete len:237 (+),score=76.37 TRINITY_DN16597_c0_g1_i1:64-774(+)